MKPFNTIGIGAAFSPNLKANISEAARLSVFFSCKLILIHVGEETKEKKEKLSRLLDEFKNEKLEFEIVFKAGNPVDVILSIVDSNNIDLLILGALQRENFLKYYVGSIARKITRKAKCSVLLLIKPSVERLACEHIVVNGLKNPKTKNTIASAFYVGKQLGVNRITVVEEISKDEINIKVDDDKALRKATINKERIRVRETSRVKKIIASLPVNYTEDIKVKSQPIFGRRGYSIGHYAQVMRADLLVMNAPIMTKFWDRLFPHDIEHILTELPTDVLILQ